MKILSLVLHFFIGFICCNNNLLFNGKEVKDYLIKMQEFDSIIIQHFPKEILSRRNSIVSNRDQSKNDVGFYLGEYDYTEEMILEIEASAIKKSRAIYTSTDFCLLKVNGFETLGTLDSQIVITDIDSSLLERECYRNKYPVPHLLDFATTEKFNLWNTTKFNIYVFDAKSGYKSSKFDLLPNPQMPANWKNGYSKGVIISKEDKIVIYWGLLW